MKTICKISKNKEMQNQSGKQSIPKQFGCMKIIQIILRQMETSKINFWWYVDWFLNNQDS